MMSRVIWYFFFDISTGELLISEGIDYVKNLLLNYDAKGVLVCKTKKSNFNQFWGT